MCRIDGAEGGQVHSSAVRKARKEHRCSECGRAIAKGEVYQYAFTVYDHEPWSHRACGHCQIAQRWLIDNCGGYIFEEVREEIEEHATEYPHIRLPLLRLAVGMRRKWKDFKSDALMPLPKIAPPILVEE